MYFEFFSLTDFLSVSEIILLLLTDFLSVSDSKNVPLTDKKSVTGPRVFVWQTKSLSLSHFWSLTDKKSVSGTLLASLTDFLSVSGTFLHALTDKKSVKNQKKPTEMVEAPHCWQTFCLSVTPKIQKKTTKNEKSLFDRLLSVSAMTCRQHFACTDRRKVCVESKKTEVDGCTS